MSILVIIVTYNAMQWAARCLESLRKSTLPVDVLVIDNGSTDGSQGFIRSEYPEVSFYQNTKNVGFGMANNRGLQHALNEGYDYVYLMNQDAWIQEDTILKLVQIAESNPEYGILGPVQLDKTEHHLELTFCQSTLRSDKALASYVSDLYFRKDEALEIYPVTYLMASHWLVSRRCLLTVGGFSPVFFQYGEDDNYLHRVLYHGLKIGLAPHVTAVHDCHVEKTNPDVMNKVYRDSARFLVLLSQPAKSYAFKGPIFVLCFNAIKERNPLYLKYAWKMVREKSRIAKCRKASIQGFAFLEK